MRSNEENALRAGAFDEYRDSRKALRRNCHGQSTGIGTKSQQALKLQQEQLKTERKTVSRKQREAEKERQFELKQQKRKEKHRGR